MNRVFASQAPFLDCCFQDHHAVAFSASASDGLI
ncbi:hypothetical protein GYH30_006506 [Glycine max]|uniref:Uncharacterized protein n=1 Tax=Glycine max TaxID=3847 RepID=A0A0R0KFJ2_SOYBN|nr:hypothetical protein GYH30_006506 [Glycine max]